MSASGSEVAAGDREASVPSTLIRWRLAIFAGLAPVLMLGFGASALANRIVFFGWGLGAGAGYLVALRWGWSRWWPTRVVTGVALLWLSAMMALFAILVLRHHEILDLGFRAVLWGVYHPLLTAPATGYAVAGALGLAGAVALWPGRRG